MKAYICRETSLRDFEAQVTNCKNYCKPQKILLIILSSYQRKREREKKKESSASESFAVSMFKNNGK